MKLTLRASRSGLAIISVDSWTRQRAGAFARAGRSSRLPDSISVTSETICHPAVKVGANSLLLGF